MGGGLAFTRDVANEYNKSADLTAVRDANGNLTGLSQASKEEFDQRTQRMEQSRKEWEENVNRAGTTYVADGSPISGSYAAEAYGGASNSDTTSTSIIQGSDYVDTSLNDYVSYGVFYDIVGKEWMFGGKSVSFLIDANHRIFVNFPYDNTDNDFAEKVRASHGAFLEVIRKSDGTVDKIVELSADEAVKAVNAVLSERSRDIDYINSIVIQDSVLEQYAGTESNNTLRKPQNTDQKIKEFKITEYLVVRSAPGLSPYAIISSVAPGDIVLGDVNSIASKDGFDWIFVRYGVGNSKSGWASYKYLSA